MSDVAYPADFLSRPCDRALVAGLQSRFQVDRYRAEWLLYRMWADFATGGGARRDVPAAAEGDSVPIEYTVIENFCQWREAPGGLVDCAVKAGFLSLDEGGSGRVLVAVGYEQANRLISGSVQKKGGYARAERAHSRRATGEVAGLRGLYAGQDAPASVDSQDQRERANALGVRVWRALGLPEKEKPALAPDLDRPLFELAVEVVRAWDEKAVALRLRDLLAVRGQGKAPARVDAVLREWVSETLARQGADVEERREGPPNPSDV